MQNFVFHLNEKGRSEIQLENWNSFQRRELPSEAMLEDGAYLDVLCSREQAFMSWLLIVYAAVRLAD